MDFENKRGFDDIKTLLAISLPLLFLLTRTITGPRDGVITFPIDTQYFYYMPWQQIAAANSYSLSMHS